MGTSYPAGVALLAIACGAPRAAPGPQPDLDNMKMYEPFAMRDEAKQPDRAIILGTDAGGGSTVLRLPGVSTEAVADAMGVKVKLATAPNPDGTVHVGIFEEKAGQAGLLQWRAGVWVAALVAANTLGKDLADFTFTASSSGEIDGPSASALVASGFLATMTGAKIDPTATLTGTINADGTIGPVGGIAEKFEAALAKGMKKLGYPSGMRIVHVNDTTTVDLAALAKAGGAVAVEVANIHDAYKLLTGTPLPAPVPVATTEMAVDTATTAAIEAKYQVWQSQVDAMSAKLARLRTTGSHPQALVRLAASADRASRRASELRAGGATAAAYAHLVAAWIDGSAATDTFEVVTRVSAGDLAGARAALLDAELDPGRALQVIAELRPTTIGGHISMMSAFQPALRGAGFASLAQYQVQLAADHLAALGGKSKAELASPAVTDGLAALVAPAFVVRARSSADSTVAVHRLEVERAKTLSYMCSLPNVRRLATSFRSASIAGMHYFDSLVVEPLASSAGISLDAARMRVATSEPDYLVAFALSQLDTSGEEIKQILGETSLAWNLMLLAGAERAYLDSAQLAAKYYSFDEARLATADRERALARLLINAERSARASARGALVATGAIPVQAKIAYQLATSQQGGELADKLGALAAFWSSATYSQTAVMLARN